MVYTSPIFKEGKPWVSDFSSIFGRRLWESQLCGRRSWRPSEQVGGIAHDFKQSAGWASPEIFPMLMHIDHSGAPFHERLRTWKNMSQKGLTDLAPGFARAQQMRSRTTNLGKFVACSAEMLAEPEKKYPSTIPRKRPLAWTWARDPDGLGVQSFRECVAGNAWREEIFILWKIPNMGPGCVGRFLASRRADLSS